MGTARGLLLALVLTVVGYMSAYFVGNTTCGQGAVVEGGTAPTILAAYCEANGYLFAPLGPALILLLGRVFSLRRRVVVALAALVAVSPLLFLLIGGFSRWSAG